jgi:hypothetical protein
MLVVTYGNIDRLQLDQVVVEYGIMKIWVRAGSYYIDYFSLET